MGHRIDELPAITTPSDSDKVVVEHDNLTSQITLARLIAAERARLNLLESKLQVIGAGSFYTVFVNTSTLTSQVDDMSDQGTYFGKLNAWNHQSVTDLPINADVYVRVMCTSANYKAIEIWSVNDIDGLHYVNTKNNGAWGGWVRSVARTEIANIATGTVTWNTTNVSGDPNRNVWQRIGRVCIATIEYTPLSGKIAHTNQICTGLPAPAYPDYCVFGGNQQQVKVSSTGELSFYFPTDTTTLRRTDMPLVYFCNY